MDHQVLVALVGAGGTLFGSAVTITASALLNAHGERRKAAQAKTALKNVYRNAFMQLNGVMRIGYVDSTERFRDVLQLAIGRASSDDVAVSLPENVGNAVHSSVPALLDSLYGCIEAQSGFNALSPRAREDERALEILFDRVRPSASVGLGLVTFVLTELGDDEYVGRNLWRPNAKRIVQYIEDERKLQKAEEVAVADDKTSKSTGLD